MKKDEIERMAGLEESVWWHVGRRHLFRRWFEDINLPDNLKILDIGCGTGVNLELLADLGDTKGVDISETALKFCRERGFEDLVHDDAEKLEKIESESKDLITALEILEHLERDEKALKNWYRVLKPGGFMLLSVPAYNWLFSAHDRALSHKRRYLGKKLLAKVRKAGFQIERSTYFVMFLFPAFALVRVLQKWSEPKASYVPIPQILNQTFIKILQFETWLTNFFALPFGSSVIVLARKPKNES